MKRLVLSCITCVLGLVSMAQGNAFPMEQLLGDNVNMMRYVKGLECVRMGDATDSVHYYQEAFDLLDPRTSENDATPFYGDLILGAEKTDDEVECELPPLTREYAAYKWLNEAVPIDNMLRGGIDCKVKLITLKSGGVSLYRTWESAPVRLMAVSQWGRSVKLSVLDGADYHPLADERSFEDGGISYIEFTASGKVIYEIVNTSEEPATIALVSDH